VSSLHSVTSNGPPALSLSDSPLINFIHEFADANNEASEGNFLSVAVALRREEGETFCGTSYVSSHSILATNTLEAGSPSSVSLSGAASDENPVANLVAQLTMAPAPPVEDRCFGRGFAKAPRGMGRWPAVFGAPRSSAELTRKLWPTAVSFLMSHQSELDGPGLAICHDVDQTLHIVLYATRLDERHYMVVITGELSALSTPKGRVLAKVMPRHRMDRAVTRSSIDVHADPIVDDFLRKVRSRVSAASDIPPQLNAATIGKNEDGALEVLDNEEKSSVKKKPFWMSLFNFGR